MKTFTFGILRILRYLILGALSILALLLIVGRLAMGFIGHYRPNLEHWLSQQLGQPITIATLKGHWSGLNPSITTTHIRLVSTQTDTVPPQPNTTINQLALSFDTLASLWHWQPIFKRINVTGATIPLQQTADSLHITGFNTQTSANSPDLLLKCLLAQKSISLHNLQLRITDTTHHTHTVHLHQLDYANTWPTQQLRIKAAIGEQPNWDIRMDRTGNLETLTPKSLNAYIHIPQQTLDPWLQKSAHLPSSLHITQASGQLWLHWQADNNWRMQGTLNLPQVTLNPQPISANITHFNTQLALLGHGTQWQQLWLKDLRFTINQHTWPKSQLYARHDRLGYRLTADTLSLDPITYLLTHIPGLPKSLQEVVTTLNPRGKMTQFMMHLNPPQLPAFRLQTQLQNIAVAAWKDAPSAAGISGTLQLTNHQGRLQLDSQKFSLGLPNLFAKLWQWGPTQGDIHWRITPDQILLNGQPIRTQTSAIGHTHAQLHLALPFSSDTPAYMGLLLHTDTLDAQQVPNYLPTNVIPDTLHTWLNNALKKGQLSDTTFLYNGQISHIKRPTDYSYDLHVKVNQGQLHYDPNWPPLKKMDATVAVTNSAADIQIQHAALLNSSTITHAHAILPPPEKAAPPALQITAQLESNGKDSKTLLTQTPINNALKGAAHDWTLSGNLGAQLHLRIPFSDQQPPTMQVKLTTQQFNWRINQANIALNTIKGNAIYDSQKGIQASNIHATLLEHPIVLQAHTTLQGKNLIQNIHATGTMDIATLSQWGAWPRLSTIAQGNTTYQADISVRPNKPIRINLHSNLQGITVNIPKPYSKPAQATQPFNLQILLQKTPLFLLSYAKRLHIRAQQRNHTPSAHLILGEQSPTTLPKQGLLISGQLPTLALQSWQNWLQKLQSNTTSRATPTTQPRSPDLPIRIENLRIGRVLHNKTPIIDHLKLWLTPTQHGNRITTKSPQLDGSLLIPNTPKGLWLLALNHLKLPDTNPTQTQSNTPPQASINPAILPPMAVSIAQLAIGQHALGAAALRLQPAPSAVKITGSIKYQDLFSARYHLLWSRKHDTPNTTARLHIEGKKIGDLLKSWGYEKNIDAKTATLDMQMHWPDDPHRISLKQLNGDMRIQLLQGRLLQVKNSANLLRIFGVLNLTTIMRRISLDFSDLFRSGISFDSIKGHIHFNDGQAMINDALRIQGPSADFQLTGCANYKKDTVNMQLQVALPLSSNLPLIAVLIGQPEIGGALWVFDALFGNKINRAVGINYYISGTLSNPHISMKKPHHIPACALMPPVGILKNPEKTNTTSP